ncbi:MAG TPA: PadR family transcriptional regulator [Gemmatimonadaceae bacterium]|jgi:transcriptional regulator|nr:PadR family transcriptional regulator [Gemmatimonadaceae bacterium]
MVRRSSSSAAEPDLGLLRGTLDLFVLKTLSWGPMHGLAVLQRIERTSDRRLQVEEGALYPALHRMEEKGWLDAEWGHTDAGRRAKFYRLTAAGRRQLTAELARWESYSEAAAMILSARGGAA